VFRVSGSAAGSAVVVADAPLASDNDNPAAPNSGTALLRRFRFESRFACDMVETSLAFSGKWFDQSICMRKATLRSAIGTRQMSNKSGNDQKVRK
jgi:hypothetical protein